ncbi:MAG: lysophospholipase L1-like esterase [Candidatus Binatia bacterium]|jgi:lysophospholipase L1-like esterase
MSAEAESVGAKAAGGRSRGWRRGCLISIVTLIVLFLLGEAAFRIFPIDRQLDYEFDEELYWRLKPDQAGYLWMGGGEFHSPPIRIDSRGFRSSGRAAIEGDGAEARVLLLGDSYTFGLGVEDDETFCGVVESRLAGLGVATDNAGGPGYGVFQSDARLNRLLASGYTPEFVVLTIPTGDVLRQPFSNDKFEQYRASQKRRKRLRSVSRMTTFFYRKYVILKQRQSDGGRAVPNERAGSNDAAFRGMWESDERRIREMKAACEAAGAQLFVLHWAQPGMDEWNEIVAAGISQLARDAGLIVLKDLPEQFANHSLPELIIPGDGHPSALAHRLTGEYLAAEIQLRIKQPNPSSKN